MHLRAASSTVSSKPDRAHRGRFLKNINKKEREGGRQARVEGQARATTCRPQESGVWCLPAGKVCHGWHLSRNTYTIHNAILAIEAQRDQGMGLKEKGE